jgi:phosphoglucan,water dikinase
MSAAGLYESVIGVAASSAREVGEAVSTVWASLYSRRAVLARHAAGVPQAAARMAVLVQEMAPSKLSFVLHTAATNVDPAAVDAASTGAASATLEAEVAVGLGETLASGARGTPWRLEVDQATGEVRTTAFASLGHALTLHAHAAHLGVKLEAVDYSRQVRRCRLTLSKPP